MNTQEPDNIGYYVYLASCLIVIGFSYFLITNPELTKGEWMVSGVTLSLAGATIVLAKATVNEGSKNRRQVNELAEKDRRRLRLKEQLEGLYSPLMGIGRSEFLEEDHHKGDHYVYNKMKDLKSKYNFLAEHKLMEKFYDYYMHTNGETPSTKSLKELWRVLEDEFVELSDEYYDLTRQLKEAPR